METKHIRLRSVEKSDFSLLYKWRNTESYRELFSGRRNIISTEEFELEYKRDAEKFKHIQFLVCLRTNGNGIGLIYSYNYVSVDGHVFVGVFMDEQFRRIGYGAEASILFIKHLFDMYPVHKISAEIYSYNSQSLSGSKSLGFVVEGEFRNHRFYKGRYWDVVRMALYRENTGKLDQVYKKIALKRVI